MVVSVDIMTVHKKPNIRRNANGSKKHYARRCTYYDKKEGMNYVDDLKIWLSSTDNEYTFEYLKFEEGTPFPEIMHKNPHIAYNVDCLEDHMATADSVIFGPAPFGDNARYAFIIKDDVIIELFQEI